MTESKKYFYWIIIFLFSFIVTNAYAALLENIPDQFLQPDGVSIDVLMSGDEFHNWAHCENGFTMIQDEITGFWCWAIAINGDLTSTGYPVHLYTAESLGLSSIENENNKNGGQYVK